MDFRMVCRTCLGSQYLNPIFKNKMHHSRFSEAMVNTTGLKIGINDGLPQNICIDCMAHINASLKFRTQCKDTEAKLLKIINNDKETHRHNINSHINAVTNTHNTVSINNNRDKSIGIEISDISQDIKSNRIYFTDEEFCIKKTELDEDNFVESEEKEDSESEEISTSVIEIDNDIYFSSEDEKPLTYLFDIEPDIIGNNENSVIDNVNNISEVNQDENDKPKYNGAKKKNKSKINKNAYKYKKSISPKIIDNIGTIDTKTCFQLKEETKDSDINKNEDFTNEIVEKIDTNLQTHANFNDFNNEIVEQIDTYINKTNSTKNQETNLTNNKTLEAIKTKINETPIKTKKGKKIQVSTDNRQINTKVLDKKRVSCKVCMKSLSVRSVTYHMNIRHPGADERKVKCELCETYVLKGRMKRHYNIMHGKDGSICKYCKLEFQSKVILLEHVATCTKKKRKPTYFVMGKEMSECEICQKKMQRASLKVHLRIKHAGLGPICDHCGRKFGNKFRLNEHLRSKHGYEKFKCAQCDFQSASIMSMKNHERWHRGEKPYVCEQCGARFHASYLLTQHKQSHRTEKLLKCDLCPASFKSNNSLHVHKAACHSGARYKCTLCARAYNCRHYVVKHLRTMHRYTGPVPRLDRKDTVDS